MSHTLWQLAANTQAEIAGFCQSLDQHLLTRLSEMGFLVGTQVTCIKRTPLNGPMVIEVGGCVYSLDDDLARFVFLSR